MNSKVRKIGENILIYTIVILLILTALIVFMQTNKNRITKQNESYVADATILSASHVNDRIRSTLNSIYNIAAFYGNSLDKPEADMDEISSINLKNSFDYFEFLPADGIVTADNGEAINVTGRAEYINGMQGETGVDVATHSTVSDKLLFSFYTPLYYDNEIIGVLCGMYNEDVMQNIISNSFFGSTSKTYICSSSGQVILAAGDKQSPENMMDVILNSNNISEESAANVRLAFDSDESYSFSFDNGNGTETGYIASLNYNKWVLIQVFPTEATDNMRHNANHAGIVLVESIIATFIAYIIYLLIIKKRKELKLVKEKMEISRIVESVTTLFSRFAVADLKNDSYYYVSDPDGIPSEGKYTDLVKYMSQYYIDEEDTECMADMVTPEHISKYMTKDVDYLQYDYHIKRKGDKWENVSLICLNRENGKPTSILYAVQNVTERKLKEIESRIALKNAFDAAKAANRAKSDFLSRMSHDIRTPMNAVMGMTAVAAMHMDDKERLTDCLNKISTSSKHLLALINDILDMSKIESGKVTLSEEPFNLAEMIESILTIMHPQIKAKNQNISMSTSNIIHEDVIGDTLRLRQVFVNIMGNAVKFTPVEGSISLDIRELESRIPDKACYEFIFTDTGIGMEQSFIDEIFEPFSRSNNPNSKNIEGTGLGMPIAKNIVSMMNGDIKVESKIGVGSKFTVRLHLTIQNLGQDDSHFLDDMRILIADDDKTAAENTREILNSIGMKATSVLGGEEAVTEVLRSHEQNNGYAAVILDWQMPNVNGIEAAARIREKIGREVPIIILSAYDWTDIEQKARDTGVDAFIAKPLFRSRLIYVLRSLMSPEEPSKTTEMGDFVENKYEGKRVLLAEDNELNREIACELLNMIGVKVETAADGRIAFETITSKPANYYDLVFMDIQMPNMNGYETAKAIRAYDREDLKTIPIVAMSADAFSDDVFRAKESGMNDHVSKPIEIPKLSEALEKWLK